MPQHDRVDELLLKWETGLDAGCPLSPEELCADWPEGLEELRQRIRLLQMLAPVLDLEDTVIARADRGEEARRSWPTVPNYEILGELGHGGMGVVYRARDRTLKRVVALKVLRPGMGARPGFWHRLVREARALARLRHENIVPIYEAKLHHGQPYLVMELVRGGSLARQLARFADDPVSAVTLLEQVARAVQHAHEQQVLHRDLKPENILLDEAGKPLVGDFGIAKLLDRGGQGPGDGSVEGRRDPGEEDPIEADELAPLTAEGATPGTPPYMAPEQFRETPGGITARTDVWALGVILYQLLTGRRPFAARAAQEFARCVCAETPPRPCSLRPDLDPPLEAIVLKCLQKDPAQRYPSAAALADDLRRWRGQPPEGRPGGWFRNLLRRLRGPSLVVAVVLLAIAVFLPTPDPHSAKPAAVPRTGEERYQQAVQGFQQQLARGEAVTLIGPDVPHPAYRWRFGQGRVRVGVAEPERGVLTVSSLVETLLEVLPDPQRRAYRMHVSMRHQETFNAFGDVGIYFRYTRYLTAEGPQHFLGKVSFADLGQRALSIKKKERMGSGVYLGLWHHGTSTTRPRRNHAKEVTCHFYVPPRPAQGPGPVRQFTVEVRPDRVRATWKGRSMVMTPSTELRLWLPTVRAQYPDLAGIDLNVPVRGALGIYLYGSSASIQRLRVEPLDDRGS